MNKLSIINKKGGRKKWEKFIMENFDDEEFNALERISLAIENLSLENKNDI